MERKDQLLNKMKIQWKNETSEDQKCGSITNSSYATDGQADTKRSTDSSEFRGEARPTQTHNCEND